METGQSLFRDRGLEITGGVHVQRFKDVLLRVIFKTFAGRFFNDGSQHGRGGTAVRHPGAGRPAADPAGDVIGQGILQLHRRRVAQSKLPQMHIIKTGGLFEQMDEAQRLR